jgi:rubredoxin
MTNVFDGPPDDRRQPKRRHREADEAFECPECGDLHLADYHRAPDKPLQPCRGLPAPLFPDDRQSASVHTPVSRFRPRYRALTADEKALHDQIKASYEEVERLLNRLHGGRYKALAFTTLEASCMWAIKQLTDNPPDDPR